MTVRQTVRTSLRLDLLQLLHEDVGLPGVADHQTGLVEPGKVPGQAAQFVESLLDEALQDTVTVGVASEQLQLLLRGK